MNPPALIWQTDAATASVTSLTGTAANLMAVDEDTFLTLTSGSSCTVTLDFASSHAMGCVALAGEMLNGVTIAVDKSADNSNWTSITLGTTTLVGNISAWTPFTTSHTARYFRITLSGCPATLRLYNVCCAPLYTLPWLDDGFDSVGMQPEATVITSVQGHLLGIQRNACYRKIDINFGQITDAELAPISAWADACYRTPKGFYFVPDSSTGVAWFGYAELKSGFKAPMSKGLYNPSTINLITRMA